MGLFRAVGVAAATMALTASVQAADVQNNDYLSSMALDATGDALYLVGGTSGDLGGNDPGGMDPWLARYDAEGNRVWLRQFGDDDTDAALEVAVGSQGDIFVVGYRLQDDRRAGTWVARFDSSGQEKWSTTLAPYFAADVSISPNGVAAVGGDVVIAGTSRDANDDSNAWVLSLTEAGALNWMQEIGSYEDDFAGGVAVDGQGNVFVAGHTNGSIDGVAGNNGDRDAWLAAYDKDGNQLYLTQWGGNGTDFVSAVAAGPLDAVYVAGYTDGIKGENAGSSDAWLARFDRQGNQGWLRQLGGTGADSADALAVDSNGNVFIAGQTDVGSGAGGDNALYVAQYNAAGIRQQLDSLDSPANEQVRSMRVDTAGNLYLGGAYELQAGDNSQAAGVDAWAARLDADNELVWLKTFGTASEQELPTDGLTRYTVKPSTVNPKVRRRVQDHYIYINEQMPPNDKLFVFFAGSMGIPQEYQLILQAAAKLGYYAVGLTYRNALPVGAYCNSDTEGGCFRDVRKEIILGQDFSDKVRVSLDDGILHRLHDLLLYLHGQHPAQGWDRWLAADAPDWGDIIVAGHSQGGGMAAMIGKLYQVPRVLMFASPEDTKPDGTPADWFADPGVTDPGNYYGFDQVNDQYWSDNRANWKVLGLDAFGGLLDIDAVEGGDFEQARRLHTFLLPSTGADSGRDTHGMVVRDLYTPVRSNGQAWFDYDGTWAYMIRGE